MSDDLDEWLAGGSRPSATVTICLAGDLAQRYQDALEEFVKASADENRSLEDDSTVKLAAEIDDLQARMAKQSRALRLEALDPEDYTALVVKHLPREGNEVDARFGFNRDTFLPALVQASLVDPAMTAAQVATLRSKVSPRQWDELWVTAQQLNREDVQAPKSLGFSALMQTAAEKSKPRGRSGSRSSGSKAGSRARSTSTTTKGD